jgi:XTP/dITP diphosphohydrolase
MHLYLATTNVGKLRDFGFALTPGVTLTPLPGIEALPVPVEDAETFEGNARIKASAYSLAAPGLLVLADDSGLEVDALAGAPGVRSARYGEDRGFTTNRPLPVDQRNNLCLLDALASTREAERTGRYRCVLALARDGEVLATAAGTVEGEILAVPRGAGGFGYDPLFYLPDEGLTMAEIPAEERNRFSHRGRALRELLRNLRLDFLRGAGGSAV